MKKNKYKNIIFDWDGTLYNSIPSIVLAMKFASNILNINIPSGTNSSNVYKNIIGLRLDIGIKKIFPFLNENQVLQYEDNFKKYLYESEQPKLFDNTEKVLIWLRDNNYSISIATGKGRIGLNRDLKSLNIGNLFSSTKCADESNSKPHPKMLIDIINELNFNKEETIMIGDSIYDMEFANNAGIDVLGVTYGSHKKEQLNKYKTKGIITDIKELPSWLKGNLY